MALRHTSDGTEQSTCFVYSQIQKLKGALSCIFASGSFILTCMGHHFTLITDHKPLLSLFTEQKAITHHVSCRTQRLALILTSYWL